MQIEIFKGIVGISETPVSLKSKVNEFIKGKKVADIEQNSLIIENGRKLLIVITVLYEE